MVLNPIPYTLSLHSYRHFGQSVFHYIFKERLEKKKRNNLLVYELRFLPKQSVHNAEHYDTDL